MGEYYKLKLNCARTRINSDMSEDNGFLNIGITKYVPKKGGKSIDKDYHFGPDYIIAKKVGTHFEELFFGIQINYNPDGIQDGLNSFNIEKYDIKQLEEELKNGITCFEYSEAKRREVNNFMNSIQRSSVTMKNYRDELKFIEAKEVLHILIRKRIQEEFEKMNSRVRRR